jgi:hypothetical protein
MEEFLYAPSIVFHLDQLSSSQRRRRSVEDHAIHVPPNAPEDKVDRRSHVLSVLPKARAR